MKLLNLGCQIHYFDGWINQDVVSDDINIKAELYCDAAKLPLEDNSIDFIYSGHLIEHYYPDTVEEAVKEWHRVLKPGGRIVIVTPDSGDCFKRYATGEFQIEHLLQQVYGRINSYDRPEERHHLIFDWIYLSKVISNQIGWSNIVRLDFNNPPSEIKPFMDIHISRAGLQLGIILTK